MKTIPGILALKSIKEISKQNGAFGIRFISYNRYKYKSDGDKIFTNCKLRKQLPEDKFNIHSENYFLFEDEFGNPKTAWKFLIRAIEISNVWYKVSWYNRELNHKYIENNGN
jgi:hypothetical protein